MIINREGINLLPKEYIQEQSIKTYLLGAALLILLECIIFVYGVVLPPLKTIKTQNTTIHALELQVGDSKYAEINQTLQNLENAKADMQKWVDKYQGIKKTNFISDELFDVLLSRVPQGLKIDFLQITQQQANEAPLITLKGKTIGNQAVYNYITILETTYKGCKLCWTISEPDSEKLYQTYDITMSMPMPYLITESLAKEGAKASIEGGVQ